MEIRSDFKELLELLNSHKVEFIVVGAYALAHHGAPRNTGDIDLWVRPESKNARRVLDALKVFGFQFPNLNVQDFETPNQVIQLGVPPGRVDLITSISGVSWDQADRGKVQGHCGAIPVNFLGRKEMVVNKRASGRKKDLADLEALGED